jgi:Dynamin family
MSDGDGADVRLAGVSSDNSVRESRLAASLQRVRELAVEEHRNDLAAAVAQELQHLGRSGALTAVVAAEVSRGKSLLINALVGREDLLPVDLDVSTGVYVVVQASESAGVRVFTRTSPEPIAASVGAVAEWVSVAGNPENVKGVSYVEVSLPSPLLGEGISFIDTPGVGGLDASHGATTLAALSDADALIFVLDSSAPLSRPELNFIVKAAQRIQSVILVMTKADVFPGWRAVLDENRQLLRQFAPRFADQEIILVRSPLFFAATRRRGAGDAAGADRFLERSGIPQLVGHLRRDLLQRSDGIRIANGHRLALSVLWQIDAACKAQLATLNGDTAPLRELQEQQKALAARTSSTEGWRQVVARSFNDVNIELTRALQEAVADFRNKFDTEIATSWRSGRHLSFPAELEADLHLEEVAMQRRLAGSLRRCAGEQAARLGIEELSAPTPTFALPDRDRMTVRPTSANNAQLAIMGGGILSGAIGMLKSILSFNPIYAFTGALGLGSSLQNLVTQRATAQQSEARRLLAAYVERFQRDCKAAIDDAIRSAADTTNEALQAQIQQSLRTLQAQIGVLTNQAAQAKQTEATKAQVSETRATIATLVAENQAGFRDALTAAPQLLSQPLTDSPHAPHLPADGQLENMAERPEESLPQE